MIEESDAHCLLGGLPHVMFTPFAFRLLQPPGQVAMVWEFMHAYRIIPLDGRPHFDPGIKLYQGDSRGHWDGDTRIFLVRIWIRSMRHWSSPAGKGRSI
jgi:hypothetical protein